MKFKNLPRKFKIGATIIEDPSPTSNLDQVHEILAQQYPLLRNTHIFESDGRLSQCGTYIEYEIVLPPVKTQG
ncbi:PRTRC system protein C [Thalassotalea piscium]|uniref:PRTRC genetic system protein C n=1 Tax=Thalassotalea piscium TaxID=1230533 RepID=A0A7X0NGP5_9GAMM|nr:PRTRC system protein C [Thalassotalea piscium]MBB6543146.1 PRTRC genetic system protein C [Thalassotalea piscium]